MKKRLLALLLCLVMVIGLVPTVLAVDPAAGGSEPPAQTSEYYVNFNVHGGTPIDKIPASQGGKLETIPTTTKYGYTFAGWYTNDKYESVYSFNPLPAPGRDGVNTWAHAKWEANTYTITFHANNTTNATTSQTFTFDDGANGGVRKSGGNVYIVLSQNMSVYEDHTFEGWSTTPNGTAQYVDMQAAQVSTLFGNETNVNLYAVWSDNQPTPAETEKFSITYYDAAAGGYRDVQIEKNTEITINPDNGEAYYCTRTDREIKTSTKLTVTESATLTTATAAGKTSLGWKYDAATKTFTAVWEKESYRVSFYCYNHGKNDYIDVPYNTKLIIDPNYGTYAGSKATQTIYVTADRSIADASRTGYYFYGWYVTKDSNGVYTFTAVWDNNYYYNTYSIYYYDYDDCKSEYANFPYGTSVVIDPNGGTAKLSGTSFSTKQSFNIYRDYTLTDAARSGYTFYGWDLTKSGSTYYFTAMWSRYKSDVPYMLNGTDHYAYIKGYPNGSFKPTDTITRAEAATIFYRLLTDSTRKAYATTYNSFKDVPATAWYNTAVSTMAKLGIVNGGADGYFRPNDPITRAEIAAMIARCDGAYYTGTSTVFSDTYGHWAASYIDRAYELGWINGYGTTYAPDRYISRAETVAVLNRVLNRAPQYTSDLTRNYTTFSDVATSAWYYLDVEEAANSHTYTRKSNADYETWTKLIADPSWF